ncbi:MAG TPA: phosphate ABC transporter permease PstA [Gaiellaceae bacterium]|jgi:phosphate transport system permease protein
MTEHGITRAEMSLANLPRRRAVNRAMEVLATLAAVLAVGILVAMVYSVAVRAWSALNLDLFTNVPHPFAFGDVKTGQANALVGSIVLVALATAMALPVGILIAIYLNEYAHPAIRNGVSLVLDVLNGIPAIVIGIFVFLLFVLGHQQSGWAGSFALACLMLPLIARSTQEVLVLVPQSIREASLGLGVPRWRTTLSIILPQTIGGILTGATLAVARVAGETAPLLLVSSLVGEQVSWNPLHALQSIPVAIFELSESPDPKDHAQAWAIALVLLLFILITSLGARALATRIQRRITTSR